MSATTECLQPFELRQRDYQHRLASEGVPVRYSDEFAEFYRGEYARLYGLLAMITLDREMAKDLTQEAFTRACLKWESLRRYAEPAAWLRRVGINLAISSRRSRARFLSRRSALVSGVEPDVDASYVILMDSLRVLTGRQRAAVALHYLDDLPLTEVARVLGAPLGTVKSDLARARKQLAVQEMNHRD